MQMIFGTLSGESVGRRNMTIEPPSPYAVSMPLPTHPSQCMDAGPHWKQSRYNFRSHIRAASDAVLTAKHETPRRGMEWGDYMTLQDKGERVTTPMLAFFADCFMSYPVQLPTLEDHRVYVV
jgi:hypothetical protein